MAAKKPLVPKPNTAHCYSKVLALPLAHNLLPCGQVCIRSFGCHVHRRSTQPLRFPAGRRSARCGSCLTQRSIVPRTYRAGNTVSSDPAERRQQVNPPPTTSRMVIRDDCFRARSKFVPMADNRRIAAQQLGAVSGLASLVAQVSEADIHTPFPLSPADKLRRTSYIRPPGCFLSEPSGGGVDGLRKEYL